MAPRDGLEGASNLLILLTQNSVRPNLTQDHAQLRVLYRYEGSTPSRNMMRVLGVQLM
jgi:hypothetical protein